MPDARRVLLEVKNLKKYFPLRQGFLGRGAGTVKAVDGISLHILQGETLGLVGESGSGKTTAGRTILRAFNPTAGEIIFHLQDGPATDLAKLSPTELRAFRRGWPHLCEHSSIRKVRAGGKLLWWLRGGAADLAGRSFGCGDGHQAGWRPGGTENSHERAAGKFCVQRTRPNTRAHDSGRCLGAFRSARRFGIGSDFRLEVR